MLGDSTSTAVLEHVPELIWSTGMLKSGTIFFRELTGADNPYRVFFLITVHLSCTVEENISIVVTFFFKLKTMWCGFIFLKPFFGTVNYVSSLAFI